MLPLDKKAIHNCLPQLCESLNRIELKTILISAKTMTHVDFQAIEEKATEYERNGLLIEMLCQRDSETFEVFIAALEETNQTHLAEMILQQLREKQTATDFPCYEDEIQVTFTMERRSYTLNWITWPSRLLLLQSTRTYLKDCYKKQFRRVSPLSLPFTFDIENTWVSLALNTEYGKQKIEDHCGVIKHLFTKEDKLLIIQGRAACGKTSLMRRFAYDWANDSNWMFTPGHMKQFDLVLIAEFRDVKHKKFKTIAGLALASMERIMTRDEHQKLIEQLFDPDFCIENRVLILLDGFDEASANDQCDELYDLLTNSEDRRPLQYNVILLTRPGYTKYYEARQQFIEVVGFDTKEQKDSYIRAHFYNERDAESKIAGIQKLLRENKNLNKLAETPMLLTFICILQCKIQQTWSLFDIYSAIVWYLLDRHHKSFPHQSLSKSFGYNSSKKQTELEIIQNDYINFPVLKQLGKMAYEMFQTVEFTDSELDKYEIPEIVVTVGLLRKEERQDEQHRFLNKYIFPHRTIQEFLAGGVFYFWPELVSESNEEFTLIAAPTFKINDNLKSQDINLQDRLTTYELENFILFISFKFNGEIQPKMAAYFGLLSKLSLDLSILPCDGRDLVQVLNALLMKCCNLRYLTLYSDSDVIVTQSIRIECLHLLEAVSIIGESNNGTYFSTEPESGSFALLKFLAKTNNKIRRIALTSCTFPAPLYLNTMHSMAQDAKMMKSIFEIENLRIKFCEVYGTNTGGDRMLSLTDVSVFVPEIGSELLHTCKYISNGIHVNEEPNLSQVLDRLKCIKVVSVSVSEQNDWHRPQIFDALPKLQQLEKLTINNIYLSLSPASLPQLKELNVNIIRQFSNDDQSLNDSFFAQLLDFKNVIKISFSHSYVPNRLKPCSEYDATTIFCLLARNMRGLEEIRITSNGKIIVDDAVMAAGRERNQNFNFFRNC